MMSCKFHRGRKAKISQQINPFRSLPDFFNFTLAETTWLYSSRRDIPDRKGLKTISLNFPVATRLSNFTLYYVSSIQLPEHFAVFLFSCKNWIPIANGNSIAPINITNQISEGILVVVLSRCIRGADHFTRQEKSRTGKG